MTNSQVWTIIGGWFAANALLVTVLVLYMKAEISAVHAKLDALREAMLNGFAEVNRRFEDMQRVWTAELHRVEGVIDARLKHLESREG